MFSTLSKTLLKQKFAKILAMKVPYSGHKTAQLVKRFIENGTIFTNVNPGIPSLHLPQYFSLVTGLSPEQHGIIDNFGIVKVSDIYKTASDLINSLPYIWKTVGDLTDNISIHTYGVMGEVPRQGCIMSFQVENDIWSVSLYILQTSNKQ